MENGFLTFVIHQTVERLCSGRGSRRGTELRCVWELICHRRRCDHVDGTCGGCIRFTRCYCEDRLTTGKASCRVDTRTICCSHPSLAKGTVFCGLGVCSNSSIFDVICRVARDGWGHVIPSLHSLLAVAKGFMDGRVFGEVRTRILKGRCCFKTRSILHIA